MKVKNDLKGSIPGFSTLFGKMTYVAFSKSLYNETKADNKDFDKVRSDSNIYFFCTRPHVRLVKGSIKSDVNNPHSQFIYGLLDIQKSGNNISRSFEIEADKIFQYSLDILEIELDSVETISVNLIDTNFPYTELILELEINLLDGSTHNKGVKFEIDSLIKIFRWHVPELQDLKVEYIGKSVGKLTPSNSPKRIKFHKARTILMNEAAKSRDIDVLILYLNFEALLVNDYDTNLSIKIDMPRPNVVSFIEEALINHFQPRLNTQAIKSFPYTKYLKSSLNNLGLFRAITSVSGDDYGFRMFSNSVDLTYHTISEHHKIGNEWLKIHGPSGTVVAEDEVQNGERQYKYSQFYASLIEYMDTTDRSNPIDNGIKKRNKFIDYIASFTPWFFD